MWEDVCVCVCAHARAHVRQRVHAICLPAFDLSQRHTCDMAAGPLDSVTNQGMHTVDTDHIDSVT